MSQTQQPGSRRARRRFSPEFKSEAVRLLHERRAIGGSLTQVGRELDVRPDLLRGWAREVDGRPEASGPVPNAEAEVRRLQQENAVLRHEREFLKKAAAFFAKESR